MRRFSRSFANHSRKVLYSIYLLELSRAYHFPVLIKRMISRTLMKSFYLSNVLIGGSILSSTTRVPGEIIHSKKFSCNL